MKPAITEAMMDLKLARLLLTNRAAVTLCLRAVDLDVDFDRIGIQRQVGHVGASGSADLVVNLWKGRLAVAIILIENKIDAAFTPDQPNRYAICRDTHRARRSTAVASLLIAPRIYLTGSRLKAGFDGTITYEDLLGLASGKDREIFQTAIERASSPYEAVPVQAVMDFFEGYAALASSFASDLRLKRNPNSADARPEASRTIYFDTRASGFRHYPFLLKDRKPAAIRVSHQCWDSGAARPSVKIMLDGWAEHLGPVAPLLRPILPKGLYLRAAGRSLAIAADTGLLDNKSPAPLQRHAICDALEKLVVMRRFWNEIEQPLRTAAAAVGTVATF